MKHSLSARVLSLLLVLVMLVGVLPMTAFATESGGAAGGFVSETHDVFSTTNSTIAPGVTQSINYAYAKDGKQMVYYVATADINREDVEVHSAYKGAQCETFGMDKLTNQMAAADAKYTNPEYEHYKPYFTAVAGVNADFYNMSTGQPSGAFVMDGVNATPNGKAQNRPWFAVFADGTALCGKNDAEWDAAVAAHGQAMEAVGGSQMLVVNGADVSASATGSYNTDRHSRTMVGVTADNKVVMAVLDGRQEPFSCGGTMHELAQIMLEQGCVMAINLDGGGSTTYAARQEGENHVRVVNRPSDGSERSISTGLLIASTAVPSDTFERATLTPEHTYVTPGSVVNVTATGVSPAGTAAELPENATWGATLGTVENGVFTSDGTAGDAVVQMLVDGTVVGETTIHVVVPTALTFDSEVITVPFGKTVELAMTATYGLNEVVMKPGDVSFTLADTSVGTIDGFSFTAAAESAASTSAVTAVLTFDESVTASAAITLGKGSEVIFDFEGETQNAQIENFWRAATANYNYLITPGSCTLATAENGHVHSGSNSMRVQCDFSAWLEGGYMNARVCPDNVIDLKGATRIGMWVYIPLDAFSLNGRIFLMEVTERNEDGSIKTTANAFTTITQIDDGGDWNVGFNTQYEESGWHYIYADLDTSKDWCITNTMLDMYINDRDGAPYGYNHFDYKSGNVDLNLFIDDITIDYSSAVEDRDAPVFEKVSWADTSMSDAASFTKGVTASTTRNLLSFSAVVRDNMKKSNYTGLDETTAKAYIDGVEVPCTIAGGIMSVADVTLADGVHSVKFAICDKQGNLATVIRKINVQAGSGLSTVKLVPHDASLNKILFGSLYYVDLVATDAEKVQSVSATLDLNDISVWELDHMDVAKGFEASYTIDEVYENIATVTITRTGESDAVGEAALVSIPIRTWQLPVITLNGTVKNQVWMYDRYRKSNELLPIDIKVSVVRGAVSFLDGTDDTFSGSTVQVDTESDRWFYNDTAARQTEEYKNWNGGHDHRPETAQYYAAGTTNHVDAVAVEDKPATCTESGYTGRTFCEVCNSVADWGTTLPATDHTYEIVDGVLKCTACGELFTGTWTDGKEYADGIAAEGWIGESYYVGGEKLTGIRKASAPDGSGEYYYDFGEDGACAGQTKYTGLFFDVQDSVYRFALFGELVSGWRMISNVWYYFSPKTNAALVGQHTINVNSVEIEYTFEETGKLASEVWYTNANGDTYRYYGPGFYTRVWKEIDGKTYFLNYKGVAARGIYGVKNSPNDPEIFYLFDLDTCELISVCDGFMTYGGSTYYYHTRGTNQKAYGLWQIDGKYYYFSTSTGAMRTGDYTVMSYTSNGLLTENRTFHFDETNGYAVDESGNPLTTLEQTGPGSETGSYPKFVEKDGKTYYYKAADELTYGFQKIDGHYYYFSTSTGAMRTGIYTVMSYTSNGLLTKSRTFHFDETHGYAVDENGKPLTTLEQTGSEDKPYPKFVEMDGQTYYYKSADAQAFGMQCIDGKYYYFSTSTGAMRTGIYTVMSYTSNGLLTKSRTFHFDETHGYAVDESGNPLTTLEQTGPGPETGSYPKFVEEDGKTYYYKTADALAFGFQKIDGHYYYFSTSTGAMRTGIYTVMSYTSNGLLTENRTFHFDETHGYAVDENGEPLTSLN